MAKRGRPTDFKPEFVGQVEKLCRIFPATDEDIADFLGKAVSTIYAWKVEHPEFSEAIKRGKATADREVSEKLHERAVGARHFQDKEVKLKRSWYVDGKKHEEEKVEIVRLHMQAPPDTPAAIFWLKNRRPDLWRDKQDVIHAGDKDAPPVFTLKIDNS